MKAIIFDFDGVIHDTFELAYKVNVEIFGEDLTKEKYRDFFNGNIFEHPEINHVNTEKFFKLQNEAFEYLKIDDNIRKNLEELSKLYPLFIISSNQEKTLETYFKNNNFIHIFKEILGAETHQSKVEKFKHLFKKHNLKAIDCIFITDTLGDILEGKKVSVSVIAVDFGFHQKDRLKKGSPFKIVSSFDEILEVIKEVKNLYQ